MSTGNILSYNGHVKLSDLEYAKKRSDLTGHEMPTVSESPIAFSGKSLIASQQGSMDFMSIEVAARIYRFYPHRPRSSEDILAEYYKELSALEGNDLDVETAVTDAPFCHNHLHDLESLWWVAAWVAFHKDFLAIGTKSSITLLDAMKRLNLARILFPPVSGMLTRQNGFQYVSSFQDACRQLGPEKGLICRGLSFTRRHLINHYYAIEAKLPESVDPEESSDDIYDIFAGAFSSLADGSKDLELKSIAAIYNQLLKEENLKHQRSESESQNDAGTPRSSKVPRE